MQLVVAVLILGNLFDRVRAPRPVLLLSMLGLGLDYVVMALAPSVGWLLLGRVISGATSASGSTAMAYVADVSTPENRARNFGLIQAAFRAGILLGPAIGGALGCLEPARAFLDQAEAMALANSLYGFFVRPLPESLAADRRRPFHWACGQPGRRGTGCCSAIRPAGPRGPAVHAHAFSPHPRSTASSSSSPTIVAGWGPRG